MPGLPGGLVRTLPERAETGAQVSLTPRPGPPPGIAVRSLHVIATANPAPEVLDRVLADPAALPGLRTRIRPAEDQRVVALALLSDGTAREASALVRITEGGCL
jgi:sulfur-oxidizing protein SoxY